MENFQSDIIDNLKIYKTYDNIPTGLINWNIPNDCVISNTTLIFKSNFKVINDQVVAMIRISKIYDIFRFIKIQLIKQNSSIDNLSIDNLSIDNSSIDNSSIDNSSIDNSSINKVQLVVGGKVMIDDLETFNMYFPLIACGYKKCEIRVFIDKRYRYQPLDNIMLTLDCGWLKPKSRNLLVLEKYKLFE